MNKQKDFSSEIDQIKEELTKLKSSGINQKQEKAEIISNNNKVEKGKSLISGSPVSGSSAASERILEEPLHSFNEADRKTLYKKADLEKFIGENLINKIGIVITVLGVAIGAKYAIEHQLISPLTRIISGYLMGLSLLVFAIWLKKKYENFSSVLLSGSMAIMYFITYSAFSFYELIPQLFAFFLMIIITAFTVMAAINYNRQVIAHIGLVGAYAIPFLLGGGSDNVKILFSYTAIINIGVLVVAVRKYWKPLYYSSFIITWMMYLLWFFLKYRSTEHVMLASAILSIFFVTFYVILLAYKLIKREKFDFSDILLLLTNSFIFYGVGYSIIMKDSSASHMAGLFTIGNALIHLIASLYIYRQKLADRNLFYLVSGLALIFHNNISTYTAKWQLGNPVMGRRSCAAVLDWPDSKRQIL